VAIEWEDRPTTTDQAGASPPASRPASNPTAGAAAAAALAAAALAADQAPRVRRVLVTGGAGFVGRAVSDGLRAQGIDVVGVDRVADAATGIVAGDTTDPSSWQAAAEGCDVVIHAAAVVSNAVDLGEQWRVNVLGTRRALDVAVAAGVRRFVHVSSVRAFSDLDFPDGVTEDHPVRPDGNPYVDTKIASEQVVLQAHAAGEIEAVIVRPGDVVGPGSQPWVVKPLELIRAGQFLLPAMGRGVFSPVDIEDLVRGLALAATHPAAAGEVFTISGPSGVSTADYFRPLVKFAGKRGPVGVPTAVAVALAAVIDGLNRLRGRRSEVNVGTTRYLARTGTYSIEKARRVLGYEPQIGPEESWKRTEAWLRTQPE
jgi:nucleoside-diphosphate-sugar epimerase